MVKGEERRGGGERRVRGGEGRGAEGRGERKVREEEERGERWEEESVE